ncbi:MAG: hypothetical protein FWF06_07390 [Symbiobacteriaceae bacterium]|nr:hypothetical protein [Symbiobacteriaceae bacterium]
MVTEEQVKKLLSDNVPRKFKQLGFSLMITRLKGLYKNNPSPVTLQRSTQEINNFLKKFAAIMQDDTDTIAQL